MQHFIRVYQLLIVFSLASRPLASGWNKTTLAVFHGAGGDNFGCSVSISGNTAVVGARLDGDKGKDAGSATVLVRNGSIWVQQQKLTASDGASYDNFGRSVSISGDILVVGSPFDDDKGSHSGSVYVYTRNGSRWTDRQKLIPSDGVGGGEFGYSVSIDGDRLVVGAWYNDDKGNHAGAAYIYVRNGSNWKEEAKLTAIDGAENDNFGMSVCISGNTVVVGASQNDHEGDSFRGASYVHVTNGDIWAAQQKIVAGDGSPYDLFGFSVSISGDRLVVGTPNGPSAAGSAYIFVRIGANWLEERKLVASDGASYDHFGRSVAISGDNVVVGARQDDDKGYNSGSAYLFAWNGSDWTEERKFVAFDGTKDDQFGYSVSISGGNVVVGALFGQNGLEVVSGSAYVYSRLSSIVTPRPTSISPSLNPTHAPSRNLSRNPSMTPTTQGNAPKPTRRTLSPTNGPIATGTLSDAVKWRFDWIVFAKSTKTVIQIRSSKTDVNHAVEAVFTTAKSLSQRAELSRIITRTAVRIRLLTVNGKTLFQRRLLSSATNSVELDFEIATTTERAARVLFAVTADANFTLNVQIVLAELWGVPVALGPSRITPVTPIIGNRKPLQPPSQMFLMEIMDTKLLFVVGVTLLMTLVFVLGYIHGCCDKTIEYDFFGALRFTFLTYDFLTDILFAYSVVIVGTMESTILFFLSTFFILVPLCLSFGAWHAQKYEWQEKQKEFYPILTEYQDKYSRFILVCSVVSGSTFGAFELANCRLFGLRIFSMNLPKYAKNEFRVKRAFFTVVTENAPQLFLQLTWLLVLSDGEATNLITFIALTSTILAIITAVYASCSKKQRLSAYTLYLCRLKMTIEEDEDGRDIRGISRSEIRFALKKTFRRTSQLLDVGLLTDILVQLPGTSGDSISFSCFFYFETFKDVSMDSVDRALRGVVVNDQLLEICSAKIDVQRMEISGVEVVKLTKEKKRESISILSTRKIAESERPISNNMTDERTMVDIVGDVDEDIDLELAPMKSVSRRSRDA